MRKPKNPFAVTGYLGKKYFCNRVHEFKIIEEHVFNERNIVLYSWRRIGKTALIKCFLHENAKNAHTLYIDLLGTRNTDDAVTRITQIVYDYFGKTEKGFSAGLKKLLGQIGAEVTFNAMTGAPTLKIGQVSEAKAEYSLHALGEFLSNQKKEVIIAIDEFQQITNYENQDGEAVFRTWMQNFPSIRFIFSGSHRHLMASMFSDKNKPFYRSAQLMALDNISIEDYTTFINLHFSEANKEITTEQIQQIYNWAEGQTYCIQLICNKLYGRFKVVSQENIATICKEILQEESAVFANYTNLLTKNQWDVSKAIAKESCVKNPMANTFIKQHDLPAASSVNRALSMLIKSEIIVKEPEGYRIHDIILSRWLENL